jgi:hypothetical protein
MHKDPSLKVNNETTKETNLGTHMANSLNTFKSNPYCCELLYLNYR